jgi:hypothetical protein
MKPGATAKPLTRNDKIVDPIMRVAFEQQFVACEQQSVAIKQQKRYSLGIAGRAGRRRGNSQFFGPSSLLGS